MTTSNFDWKDPFHFTEQLTQEERIAQAELRKFCETHLRGHLQEVHRTGYDPGIIRELGRLGLLGSTIDGYGGAGASHVSYGIATRELERVDAGYRGILSVQGSLVMNSIFHFGSPAQKSAYLPKLATGELIGCFGMTEPEHGSNPAAMETSAREIPGGYRLNGHKMWISFSPVADLFIIWAKLQGAGNGPAAVRGFILAKGAQGLEVRRIADKVGLPNSSTGEVMLTDVFVPEDHLLPEATGLTGPLATLSSARYGIAWGALGAAEDCWMRARDYAMERKPFGRPLAQTQLAQGKLATMQSEIALGLQGCLRVGRLLDEGRGSAEMISLIKRNSCEKALQIARMARDMHGGNGLRASYGIMHHVMNLEADSTYEGTHDIHSLVLGRSQTGLQAFY
ncbi:MAG: acyl-CoA dehydrogenase [Comamonas sp. SCN 67-35]|uniref:acyl-CoA dehydrogenase family protein n=1 Tax=unclassified Comamonas TaxID=2638500 RepID=UPI000869254A|nr:MULTISPECIES: acyl-CoA dehydrogenase family protein [unclassified Comamonas]MBN9330925.1 acyl-CoA dehydrogenase family protein [Comamonas sp.]ODU38380.1 MAG: acyl-CoA dehydrogenase [Comamonas sp. SCN 67-35]OJW95445.1 MAG: acyl-CoA dehydrogenase [Burkholderiales bacterium 66-26]